MSTRENILRRIRAAQGKPQAPLPEERQAVEAHLAARPQSPRPIVTGDLAGEFRARALALASTIDIVASMEEAPAAVAAYLERNALPRSAVCWPELANLHWTGAGLSVEARAARESDLIGITGVFCAIAETGTLMLLSGPRTPAVTSLVVETHVALVPAERVVAGMEGGWRLLRAEHPSMPRAVNFVSGPSRTADIEQTVTLGAHGPYRVHIVLIAHRTASELRPAAADERRDKC
jgi:L-lactate dehydrogenase complex protein LldG